jgi:hypothetical protein
MTRVGSQRHRKKKGKDIELGRLTNFVRKKCVNIMGLEKLLSEKLCNYYS